MNGIKSSFAARLRALPAALLLLLGPGPIAAQEAPKLLEEFEQSFRTEAKSVPGFKFEGPNAARCVHFEAQGLRIHLPLGHAGYRPSTGLNTTFGARGDFEVTMAYEVLREPGPEDGAKEGTRINLAAVLNTPQTFAAAMTRLVGSKGGAKTVAWWQRRETPDAKMADGMKGIPAKEKSGRLRLARSGKVLTYLASPGVDEEFQVVHKMSFDDGDVKFFRIAGSTNDAKASLEVRITDFHLRAESIPGMPAADGVVAADDPASSREGGRRIWWALGIVALVLGLLLAGWFVARRRKNGTTGEPAHAGPEAATPAISFACPECGKVLKIRGELAGKQVRCPRCAASVKAPGSGAVS